MRRVYVISPEMVAVHDKVMSMTVAGYHPSKQEIAQMLFDARKQHRDTGVYEAILTGEPEFLKVIPDRGLTKGIPPSEIPPEPSL